MNSLTFFLDTVETISLCEKNKNKNEVRFYKNYDN